ncbi:MAG: AMP-binding protein [Candidatus Binatia bacterium]
MSKGAVGLTAGYWPEDIYRYLAIPGISLDDGLITRPGRRRADHPAVISYQGIFTYRQLAAEMDQTMKAILSFTEGKSARLAIAIQQPLDLVKVIFGAVKGRCSLFLMNPSLPAHELTQQLDQFSPDLVITDDAHFKQEADSLPQRARVIQFQELEGKGTGIPVPRGRQDLQAPAIALALGDGGLVYHSHKSLLAGAVSWSTFVPLKAEDLVLGLQPLYTWEGLYSLFPVLFRGGTCLLASLEDPDRLARAVRNHRPCYSLLPRPEAAKLYRPVYSSVVQAFRQCLQGLFVSVVGPFTAAGRRRLRNLLQKPALLTYGSAESGAVLSSHPTWYLDAAVGIPLTNVDVWPLDPSNGNPLEVPWETIEYAEIGVKSPMTAADYQTPEKREKYIRGGWSRTWIVATMDPNGLFYLQSRIPD